MKILQNLKDKNIIYIQKQLATELAIEFGVSYRTAKEYLDFAEVKCQIETTKKEEEKNIKFVIFSKMILIKNGILCKGQQEATVP